MIHSLPPLFLTHSLREEWKQTIGIFILIISPSHLQKKLVPAAVRESCTSLCSSFSIEQLWLSCRETHMLLWSLALSPQCLHPPPPNWPTMETVGSSVSAPGKHLKQDYKQITVAERKDKALVCHSNSYPPSPLPVSLSCADPLLKMWLSPLCIQHHISASFDSMPRLFM